MSFCAPVLAAGVLLSAHYECLCGASAAGPFMNSSGSNNIARDTRAAHAATKKCAMLTDLANVPWAFDSQRPMHDV
jgi:hypothetical protein